MNRVEVDSALQKLETRNRRIEILAIVFFFFINIVIGWTGWIWLDKYQSMPIVRAFLSITLAMTAGVLLLNVISNRLRQLCPGWIIDESDPDVLRLYGSVYIDGSDMAAKRLLARRVRYRIVDNAYKRYGCTMAAIPEGPEYRAAKTKLLELGMTERDLAALDSSGVSLSK